MDQGETTHRTHTQTHARGETTETRNGEGYAPQGTWAFADERSNAVCVAPHTRRRDGFDKDAGDYGEVKYPEEDDHCLHDLLDEGETCAPAGGTRCIVRSEGASGWLI